MHRVGSLVVSCLLVVTTSCADTEASNVASFFSKGLKAVGSNTADAAKTVGGGLQAVGNPISAGVDKLGSASANASKSIGEGLETVGSASRSAADAGWQEVQKDLQTIKQPIDTTIAYIGSSQCQNVQKIFGVTYDQLQGDNGPNLNNLELVYKTQYFTTTMNITQAPASLRQARTFDQDERLVVYLHGFTDDPSKIGFETVSQAYLDEGRLSVVALDASSLIRWLYIRSATYVRFIGEKLGQVLAAVVEQGQDPKLIHIVGHSLGAHIGSFTCKEFERLTGQRVGRMTGLDPAGPCFSNLDPDLRLKRGDAEYVDVIHTDAGVYGLKDPCGDKDYYPNSGAEQPDCILQTCSHSRAWELYAETVLDPLACPAVRCGSWDDFKKGDCDYDYISHMGHSSSACGDGDDQGLYFLQTGEHYPYALGLNGTTYTNNNGILKNVVEFAG